MADGFVEEIIIRHNKAKDEVILGEMQKIATENGITTEIDLNERFIINALKRQKPEKVRVDNEGWFFCPSCYETFGLNNHFGKQNKYCGDCGQRLDWGNYKRTQKEG